MTSSDFTDAELALFRAIDAVTLAPCAALSQDNTDAMRALAAQLRQQALQMKGQLPAQEADMLHFAEEIESNLADGLYKAAPVERNETVAERIACEHGGRVDWLAREPVCTGYSWENVDTFRLRDAIAAPGVMNCAVAPIETTAHGF